MGALRLDELTWPEIEREQRAGRTTVVVAFGATEQHGPHLSIATDRLLGEGLAWRVAERLDAFAAPTVPFGCSSHHLAFPGTISLEDATFHALVRDLVASFAAGGFERVVLLPSHGGNLAPLAAAVAKLDPIAGVRVDAVTDLALLAAIPQLASEELGVPVEEGGLHAGEWETSMILADHPEAVDMERREAGYTGSPQEALAGLFDAGVHTIAPNGVIGDPERASAEHGDRYWAMLTELALRAIDADRPADQAGSGPA